MKVHALQDDVWEKFMYKRVSNPNQELINCILSCKDDVDRDSGKKCHVFALVNNYCYLGISDKTDGSFSIDQNRSDIYFFIGKSNLLD